ncbi:hypothetical protein [Variovorax sp. PBL-E5]|uniref:hypothetical protein n=1 Tax=Variovorax sp. PBL-E5 TaxID=434014 RepID=UPI0013167AE9|nr:hypothetical protein [Variovorax sp. PBL-E5]VTU39203.1 hypothetical protein E5CHR_05020 [Variovorax sp. PBL-E5]
MKPLIEIHRIGPGGYAYRISALGSDAQESGESGTFDSLARCLFDAGASLDHYFARVDLKLEGMFIGACTTDVLRRDPQAVARRIQQHFQPASA